MRMIALALALALAPALGLAACATNTPPPIEETPLTGSASAAAAASGASADPAPPAKAAPLPSPAFFLRRDVQRVLDRGPHDFLASIDEDPLLEGNQFRGWVFRGWRDDRYAIADLLPGDIILRINGKPIERPEQFMEVWDSLRNASELVIETQRAGKPRTLRYPIRD